MSNTSSGGIGFCGALLLLLLGLRLTGHIDWAWYWIAAPLWAPLGFLVLVALAAGLVYVSVLLLDELLNSWRARRREAARISKETP